MGEIALGSPPQVLSVMFDTGSSIAYALTSRCQKGCPARLAKFDPELSGTFIDYPDRRQDQNYGQGFVTGDLAQDQVCFSQETDRCDTLRYLAVDGGNELGRDQFSGIVGLAPPNPDEPSAVPAVTS